MKFKLILLLSILGLIIPVLGFAATYYVSNSGNDSSADPTNINTPWKTISKVNSSMGSFNAGDSILFKRGDTWNLGVSGEATKLNITCSGSSGSEITFGTYGSGNLPLFDASLADDWQGHLHIEGKNYIILEYIDVYNSFKSAVGINVSLSTVDSTYITIRYCTLRTNREEGYYLIDCPNKSATAGTTNHIYVHDNIISGSTHNGVKFYDGCQYIYIYNNIIHSMDHHGIDTLNLVSSRTNSYYEIYGNEIYSCSGMYLPNTANFTIYENDIYNTAGYGSDAYTYAIKVASQGGGSGSGHTIRNNRIWDQDKVDASTYAIDLRSTSNCNVWNNTIYSSYNTFYSESNSGLDVHNNLTYGNTNDNHTSFEGVQDMMDSHWTGGADPKFVDPTGSPPDFHLQSDSPCIDHADTVDVGLSYIGARPDFGAYEYGSTIPKLTGVSIVGGSVK